jgi:hypothetical protein
VTAADAANGQRAAAACLFWARRRSAQPIREIVGGLTQAERHWCVEALKSRHLEHLDDRQLSAWMRRAASKSFFVPEV